MSLEVRGPDAYGRLKYEAGVHRVQRVPVTESQGRIHTSTATVAVMPEAEEVEVDLRPEDLQIDVYRSSGPGGQSVNTTDSAVRITSQAERDQDRDAGGTQPAPEPGQGDAVPRAHGCTRWPSTRPHEKEAATRRAQLGTGSDRRRSAPTTSVRSGSRDHRIKHTSHQLQDVLAGGEELDGFADRLLAAERAAQLSADGD